MVRFVGWGAGPDSSYATRTANLGTAQNTAERWNKFNNRMNLMSQLTSDVGNLIEAPGSERYAAKVAADKEARRANMETVDAYGGAFDRQEKVVTGLQTHIASLIENNETPSQELKDKLAQAESLRDQYGANYQTALASIGILGGDTADEKRKKIASGDQADTSRENFWSKGTPLRYPAEGGVTEVPIGGYKEVVGTELLTAGNQEAVSPNAEDVDSSFSNALLDTAMATADDAWKFATNPDARYNPGVEAIAKDIGRGNPLGKQWLTNMFDAATNRDNWSIFPSERRRILHDAGYNFGVRPGFPIEPPRGGPPETPRSVRPEPQIERNLDKFTPSPYSQVETSQSQRVDDSQKKDETPLQADLSQNPKWMTPDEMSALGNQFWNGVDKYAEKVFGENKDIALAGLLAALSLHPVGKRLLKAKTKKQFEKAAQHPKVREVVKDFMRGRQSDGPPLPKDWSATRRAGPPVNPNPRPRVNLNLRPEQKDILKLLK